TSDLERELSFELAPEPLDLAVLPASASQASVPQTVDRESASGVADATTARAQQLVETADGHVRLGELLEAVPLYLEAVAEFRDAGELLDAGLAEANAARCAHLLEDVPGADGAYRSAIALLRAAGAPAATTSAVARSWVRVALEAGSSDVALESLAGLRTEIVDALADSPDRKVARSLRTELAESLDTHARVLSTQREVDSAVRLAVESAELF